MGLLSEKIKLALLVNGNDLVDNFKNNSLFFYDKYSKSDEHVKNINIGDLYPGNFYFLHYQDPSNWMKYAPIFAVDYRKFNNQIVLMAVNLNFIPLQFREVLFDKFMNKDNFDKNLSLTVDYKGVYDELFRLGFEYALMEFNVIQIKIIHHIHMDMLPRFLYSQHPINKYDPNKLMEIWEVKISTKQQRNQEIIAANLKDFYDLENEISEQYTFLKKHIQRIQNSLRKFK